MFIYCRHGGWLHVCLYVYGLSIFYAFVCMHICMSIFNVFVCCLFMYYLTMCNYCVYMCIVDVLVGCKDAHVVNGILRCLQNLLRDCLVNRMKILSSSNRRLAIIDAARRFSSREVRERVVQVVKNLSVDMLDEMNCGGGVFALLRIVCVRRDETSCGRYAEALAEEFRMARRG